MNCKTCGESVQDDGYGEPVHVESNRYWHGDQSGRDGHVAKTDDPNLITGRSG